MGIERAAAKTPCTAQELVDALVAIWPSEMGGNITLPEACVLAAQWALETGAGASMVAFNIGNLKCPDVNAGDWCMFSTFEYVDGARVDIHPPDPGCRFQAFATLQDGVQNYLHGMWSHWTKAWPSVCAGDPEGFAKGLHDQGYYTAPVASYAAGVRRYFDLYMRTLHVPTEPAPPSS